MACLLRGCWISSSFSIEWSESDDRELRDDDEEEDDEDEEDEEEEDDDEDEEDDEDDDEDDRLEHRLLLTLFVRCPALLLRLRGRLGRIVGGGGGGWDDDDDDDDDVTGLLVIFV